MQIYIVFFCARFRAHFRTRFSIPGLISTDPSRRFGLSRASKQARPPRPGRPGRPGRPDRSPGRPDRSSGRPDRLPRRPRQPRQPSQAAQTAFPGRTRRLKTCTSGRHSRPDRNFRQNCDRNSDKMVTRRGDLTFLLP